MGQWSRLCTTGQGGNGQGRCAYHWEAQCRRAGNRKSRLRRGGKWARSELEEEEEGNGKEERKRDGSMSASWVNENAMR